jgi:hypothetical protein
MFNLIILAIPFSIFLVVSFITYKILSRNGNIGESTLYKSVGVGFVLTVLISIVGTYKIFFSKEEQKESKTLTKTEILDGTEFADYGNNKLNFFNRHGDTLDYIGKLNFISKTNQGYFDNLRGKVYIDKSNMLFIEGYVNGNLELINSGSDLIGTLSINSSAPVEPTNMKLSKR